MKKTIMVLCALASTAIAAEPTTYAEFLDICHEKFDIIFADPPYALEDLATIPDKVFSKDILHPGAYFILEHPEEYNFESHPMFLKEKKYGNVHFSFFEMPVSEED